VSRFVAAILMTGLIALIAGCGLAFDPQGGPVDRAPVSGEEIGPIFPAPNGGPPIECRGLTRERCEGPGMIEDPRAGVRGPAAHWTTSSVSGGVTRVIVSCQSRLCDESGGEFRIDVVFEDGSTQEIGAGGYGETQQGP